jgi:hypothetical protein
LVRPDWAWLRDLRYRWDALSNGWNQWVLGYNPQRQIDLLRNLGMSSPDWQSMTAALSIACGLLMLGLTAWALQQRQRINPALAVWNRLSRKLRRRGLERFPWEGPRQYAERVATAQPRLAEEMSAIAAMYEQLRYGAADRADALQDLKRRIAMFSP